jgi:hypothetical protein
MVAASTGLGFQARPHIRRTLRAFARGATTIACMSAIAVLLLGIRYLVFEYNHGDRQVVLHLIESLAP